MLNGHNIPMPELGRRLFMAGSALAGLGVASAQAQGMVGTTEAGYVAAYVFRRLPDMSLEDFLDYYENIHGPRMVELMSGQGLVFYTHYPIRPTGPGDDYVPTDGPAFDAISVYGFTTAEAAHLAWTMPEVAEDSQNFIDFETMVMLPLTMRKVYP